MAAVDYATLSLADVRIGLEAVARETHAAFGGLDARQLNWRPTAAGWSIAQCFDHLVTADRLTLQAADDARRARHLEPCGSECPSCLVSWVGR